MPPYNKLRLYNPGLPISYIPELSKSYIPSTIPEEDTAALIKKAYLDSFLTPAQKPVYEAGDIAKDVGQAKGFWGKLGAGLGGVAQYLGTAEGQKYLAPMTKSPYTKEAIVRRSDVMLPQEQAQKIAYEQAKQAQQERIDSLLQSNYDRALDEKKLEAMAIKSEREQAKEERENKEFEMKSKEHQIKVESAIAKAKEKEEKKQIAKDNLLRSARDSLSTIEKIEAGKEFFGMTGSVWAVPGLQEKKLDWQANVDKLMSTLVLDVMSNLKRASATGSTGFGQLSVKELELLQGAATALRKTQSPEKAQVYLDNMKKQFQKILAGNKKNNSEIVNNQDDPLGLR